MKKIILATNNAHKVEEIKKITEALGYHVLTKKEAGFSDFDVEETEDSLEGNALLKAEGLFNLVGDDYIVLADDTGLFVDALKGAPGVMSARYAGQAHDDEANKKLLLENMKDVEDKKRQAAFKTVIALVERDRDPIILEGRLDGRIAREERGHEGFGYDPLFIPEGYDSTFAELGMEIKNKISHRSRALEKLADYLKDK